MKIYNTTRGILLEHESRHTLAANLDWDDLLNRDGLHRHLLELHRTLPATSEAAALLATGLLPPCKVRALGERSDLPAQQAGAQEESKDGGAPTSTSASTKRIGRTVLQGRPAPGGRRWWPGPDTADSSWNVPEPELTLVLNRHGRIVGYTIGNDMSSRSIEGENPLYLPQAKTYDAARRWVPACWCAKTDFRATRSSGSRSVAMLRKCLRAALKCR